MMKGIVPAEERTVSDMLNNMAQGGVAPLDQNADTEDAYGAARRPPIVWAAIWRRRLARAWTMW